MSFICAKPGDMLTFTYLNHKGVTSVRKVFFVGVDYGSNEYYPEPQWLLRCTDPERDNAHRSFAIANISGPIDVQHYEQIDLEKGFFQQMCAAASESNWIPPEYHANDWVSDVCTFLRNGPQWEPPKPIAPIPNSIVASYDPADHDD